jgi:hypothetical protein
MFKKVSMTGCDIGCVKRKESLKKVYLYLLYQCLKKREAEKADEYLKKTFLKCVYLRSS